jgi:hypothetical protein
MFDPTAYENMKVVMEGSLYDRDLDGVITILDRNDIINMAKLSRTYEIFFAVRNEDVVKCTFSLSAELKNLAAELLPSSKSTLLSGSHIQIVFQLDHPFQKEIDVLIERELKSIWGNERSIKQMIHINPSFPVERIHKVITIEFNRLVLEDQIDDMVAMVDYMILSLRKIRKFVS